MTIYTAIYNDDNKQLSQFLQGGANPDELDNYLQSPLFYVVYNKTPNQRELLNLLIKFGADLNFKKKDGATPLFHAKGSVARILLENGADINTRSLNDSTALHFSMDKETVQILLDFGGDINAKDKSLSTPLHDYVYFGSALVQFAIDRGADVNVQNNLGWTPLICLAKTEYANKTDNLDIIKTAGILLEAGASINIIDNEGMTAKDHAIEININNIELADYLINWSKD